MNKEIVTTEELAKYWQVDVDWIYRNRKELGIPYFKLGCQYRYRMSDIYEFEVSRSNI